VAAVEVAEMVARHRPRTLLVNTVTGSAGPDATLLPGGGSGLGDVIAGRCRVTEVAFTPVGRSFIVVPAGPSAPGFAELCGAPAFRHLVGAAGRGGTLLVHVTESDLVHLSAESVAGAGLGFDGLVLLGGGSIPRNLPPGLRVLARVESEIAVPVRAGASKLPGGRTSGFTKPSRTPAIVAGGSSRKKPRSRLEQWSDNVRRRGIARGAGRVAAVWMFAVLAVWLVWQGLSGWPAFEDDFDAAMESPPAASTAAGNPSRGTDVEDAESAGGPVETGGALTADDSPERSEPSASVEGAGPGVELPYSILVASVVIYADAAAKRDEVAGRGGLAFIAPTPVSGRLYYRVFAGAVEDREQARDLMRRLVEEGSKERERDWDMRPVRLSLALGDFPTEEEADTERQRLHESGVPAYVLSVGDGAGAVYRLYSGAFESEGAASLADSLLSVAGHTATLVTRRGEPR
jgi:cell division septation protein DedD